MSFLSCQLRKVVREDSLALAKVANLDFEARVPVPFSIFPSTYKDSDSQTITKTHEELEIKFPSKQSAGREGQYSSFSASASSDLPPRGERKEEVHITREEERYRRPGVQTEKHYTFEQRRYVQIQFFLTTRLHLSLSMPIAYTRLDWGSATIPQITYPRSLSGYSGN